MPTSNANSEANMRIYKNPNTVEIPNVDLLTLLFDHPTTLADSQTPLHLSASNPQIHLTKPLLRTYTERIAHFLRHALSIGSQGPYKDVVVVCSSGQPLLPALFYGIIASGGVFSAASPSFTAEELARQIRQGDAKAVVVSEEAEGLGVEAARLAGVGRERVLVVRSEPDWSLERVGGRLGVDFERGERLAWRRVEEVEELKRSLIVLLYSSGTTGVPKGVMLSHYNLVAELYIPSIQARTWAAAEMEKGVEFPPLRTLAHLPIAHIAGVFGYLISPMYSNGSVFWMRKFNWPQFLENMKRHKITVFYTVPSIFLRIAKSPDVTDQFETVESAITGAAPMDAELQQAANRRLGKGGKNGMGKNVFISQTWGLSETTGAVTAMPRGETDDTGSISPVLPNMEMRLVDDSYNDVEPGQPGEVLVRGPLVTNGYYNNPTATTATFHNDWFCTGDIALQNPRTGKFYIVDRKKELLKYKGLQIAPAEIENLLITHPAIQEAAVVGVPVEGGSEVPRAYVVADRGKVSEGEIREFVKGRLAEYKQLRGGVRYVDELPKNAVGKILRRELRERARGERVKARL